MKLIACVFSTHRPILARYNTRVTTAVTGTRGTRGGLRGLFSKRACGIASRLPSLPNRTGSAVSNLLEIDEARQSRSQATMKRAAEDVQEGGDGPGHAAQAGEEAGSPRSESDQQRRNGQRRKPPPAPPSEISPSLDSSTTDYSSVDIWQSAMLLVDKPKTWTSFDVCGKIRGELGRAMKVKPKKIKVGHAGTLDPMATGLLIVCVGKGTKSIDTLMGMPKEYSGTMKLGEATDSYDADGEILSTHDWEGVTNERLEELINAQFMGTIQQVPPMFSALKQGGKKLCDLAREGKEVERQAREIVVERYDVTREDPSSQMVDYYVRCSKGTYIRCLAHDLGQAAGCGAHLTALRREKIGDYDVKDAWQVDDLVAFIKRFQKS